MLVKIYGASGENPEARYSPASCIGCRTSKLRALNVTQLRALDKTLVIQDNDKPLAVLLKYEHFIAMQEKMPDEE
jgi:hypothetical protein